MERSSPAAARRAELLGELDGLVRELKLLGMSTREIQEHIGGESHD